MNNFKISHFLETDCVWLSEWDTPSSLSFRSSFRVDMLPATVTFSHELTLHIYIYKPIHSLSVNDEWNAENCMRVEKTSMTERARRRRRFLKSKMRRERKEDQNFYIHIKTYIYKQSSRWYLKQQEERFHLPKKIKFLSHSIALVSWVLSPAGSTRNYRRKYFSIHIQLLCRCFLFRLHLALFSLSSPARLSSLINITVITFYSFDSIEYLHLLLWPVLSLRRCVLCWAAAKKLLQQPHHLLQKKK